MAGTQHGDRRGCYERRVAALDSAVVVASVMRSTHSRAYDAMVATHGRCDGKTCGDCLYLVQVDKGRACRLYRKDGTCMSARFSGKWPACGAFRGTW